MKKMLNYYYKLFPDKIYKCNDEVYFFCNEVKYYIKKIGNKNLEEYMLISNYFNERKKYINTIINNKDNKYITEYENKNYVVIKVNDLEYIDIELKDLYTFMNNEISNLKTIEVKELDLMKNEVDNFEELIVNYNKEYMIIQNVSNYIIGLAENSISYLTDAIKECGDGIRGLCHKCLTDKYKCLIDIFNFEINYRLKDIIEYIRILFIKNSNWKEELVIFLKNNKLSEFEYRYLYSKIVYPREFFDEIMILIDNNKDYNSNDIYKKIKINEKKLNEFYNIIDKYCKIPSIWWLNN